MISTSQQGSWRHCCWGGSGSICALMIAMGMDHQQSQYICFSLVKSLPDLDANRDHLWCDWAQTSPSMATSLQLAKLKEQDNDLCHAIATWSNIQQLYMPIAAAQRECDDAAANSDAPEPNAEDIHLLQSLNPVCTTCMNTCLSTSFSSGRLRHTRLLTSYNTTYDTKPTNGISRSGMSSVNQHKHEVGISFPV